MNFWYTINSQLEEKTTLLSITVTLETFLFPHIKSSVFANGWSLKVFSHNLFFRRKLITFLAHLLIYL